jgi:hypothetical protein
LGLVALATVLALLPAALVVVLRVLKSMEDSPVGSG